MIKYCRNCVYYKKYIGDEWYHAECHTPEHTKIIETYNGKVVHFGRPHIDNMRNDCKYYKEKTGFLHNIIRKFRDAWETVEV